MIIIIVIIIITIIIVIILIVIIIIIIIWCLLVPVGHARCELPQRLFVNTLRISRQGPSDQLRLHEAACD